MEWLFCRQFQLKVFVKHSVLAPGGGGGWFSRGELAYVQPYKTGKAEPTGERANSKMWSSAPRPTFRCVRAVEEFHAECSAEDHGGTGELVASDKQGCARLDDEHANADSPLQSERQGTLALLSPIHFGHEE